MQVLEIMERVNSTQTNLIIKFIRNAFQELQEGYYEKTKTSYINLISGVSDYNLPADYVALVPGGSDNGIQINDNIVDSDDYRWTVAGRKLRIYKINSEDELGTPDESYTNGIAITHTYRGYDFIRNPSGDSSYYTTGGITSGDEILIPDPTQLLNTIISVTDQTPSIRTDYAKVGHHYQRTAYDTIEDESLMTTGNVYMISAHSLVSFTGLGASANTVGTIFLTTDPSGVTLTQNDSVEELGTPITSGTLTKGVVYMITAQSALDFKLDGAADSNVNTVFTATGSINTMTTSDNVIALPTWETINFLDTDLYTDVSSLTSPDEYSYIDCDETIAEAIIENVRSQLAGDDVAMERHRH
ncbi:MAG: hypothetical protein U9N61_07565, partial [Euryarchaeota archaeon]|nr:hypothetical protein [Euryarchaeota archaeon]